MWPFKAIEKAVKDVGKVVEDVVNVVGDAVEDEVKVTADRFRKHKGKKILIYDASRCKNKKKKKGPMQTMWAVGAETKNRGFDHIIKAKSWEYAFEKLEKIRNKHDIEWIEFWGHGAEGEAFIGSDCLDLERFEELCDEHNIKASDMKHGRKYTPLIWFRTCNTASGEAGEEFLRGIADKLNVNAYAHNQTIHLDQNGVCCARRDGTYDENCAKRTKHLFSIYPE